MLTSHNPIKKTTLHTFATHCYKRARKLTELNVLPSLGEKCLCETETEHEKENVPYS